MTCNDKDTSRGHWERKIISISPLTDLAYLLHRTIHLHVLHHSTLSAENKTLSSSLTSHEPSYRSSPLWACWSYRTGKVWKNLLPGRCTEQQVTQRSRHAMSQTSEEQTHQSQQHTHTHTHARCQTQTHMFQQRSGRTKTPAALGPQREITDQWREKQGNMPTHTAQIHTWCIRSYLWPWSTKPVLSRWGIFCSNSQKYIAWVKILIFMPKSLGY